MPTLDGWRPHGSFATEITGGYRECLSFDGRVKAGYCVLGCSKKIPFEKNKKVGI